MNISEFVEILKSAPHFDFILFDACFMQAVEVTMSCVIIRIIVWVLRLKFQVLVLRMMQLFPIVFC